MPTWLMIAFVLVLVLPGLALLFGVVLRVLFKGVERRRRRGEGGTAGGRISDDAEHADPPSIGNGRLGPPSPN